MKYKYSLRGFAFIVILFCTLSCNHERNIYHVSLNDSISQAIKVYVSENSIDVNSCVITTDWVSNPYRTDVYISNTYRQIEDSLKDVPSYYSLISDSIIVFVYSGVEGSIGRKTHEISMEISDLLIKKNVKLKPSDKSTYHTRTWLYTSCGGKGELIREPAISDLFYIGCREIIEPDSIRDSRDKAKVNAH